MSNSQGAKHPWSKIIGGGTSVVPNNCHGVSGVTVRPSYCSLYNETAESVLQRQKPNFRIPFQMPPALECISLKLLIKHNTKHKHKYNKQTSRTSKAQQELIKARSILQHNTVNLINTTENQHKSKRC